MKKAARPSARSKKRAPAQAPQPDATNELFAVVADRLLGDRSVTSARMFGSSCLKVGGKVFAVGWKGRLVLKLPADRVDGLVKSGAGVLFDPGHGRTSKEWISVAPDSADAWLKLATSARQFVAAGL